MTSTAPMAVRDTTATTEVTTPHDLARAATNASWGAYSYRLLRTAMLVAAEWSARVPGLTVYVCQAPRSQAYYCCTSPRGGTQHYEPVMRYRDGHGEHAWNAGYDRG